MRTRILILKDFAFSILFPEIEPYFIPLTIGFINILATYIIALSVYISDCANESILEIFNVSNGARISKALFKYSSFISDSSLSY